MNNKNTAMDPLKIPRIPVTTLRILLFAVLALGGFHSAQAKTQTVQCCNTASGDWSKSPSVEACQAQPGHVPYSPANTSLVMPCMQKTQQQAQDYMNKSGLMPKVSGLPTGALPPEVAKLLSGSQQPEVQPDCCQAASGEWLGAMAPDQCLAEDGQFPDTPDYLEQTQSCRPATGGGAWSTEDFEDNIPNGDLEIWEDDNNPQSFAPFGIPAGAQASAQGFEMETVFRSSDAHTGQFSARLQNFDMGKAVRKMGAPIVIDLPGQGAGMNSCQDNCTLKSGQAPAGGGSLSETVLPISEAKPYFCGAYKGFIAAQDQLNVTAALAVGGKVVGGTDSGTAGHSNFTQSSADWFTFALPFNTQGADLDNANGVIISAQVQPRNLIGQVQAGGMPAGVSTTTRINVDSFHFCELVNLTAYHPTVLTEGKEVALGETEEEQGVQTFVNLDNDDQDGKFDLHDTDGVRADNELVKFRAVLPLNSRGQGEFKISGVDKQVRLWANANKSKPFEHANQELDIAELLPQDREGSRRERTFWIEGIAPSKKPQDIEVEFVFKNAALGGEEFRDKISMTVLGIEDIVWEGRGNGVGDTDELDPDPNWPKGQSQQSVRVFPGKRFRGEPEPEPRNLVDARVILNVKPVRSIPLFFRSFDVDDPTASGDEVDREDDAWDNRGIKPSQWGQFEGTLNDILWLDMAEKEATFGFKVTMQPGDNFRIAGSGDRAALKAMENDDPALYAIDPKLTALIVDKYVFAAQQDLIKAQVRQQNQYVSDVLTVWRKLYLEVDTMGPVKGNEVKGKTTTVEKIGMDGKSETYKVGLNVNLYAQLPEESQSGLKGWENNYRGGEIFINGPGYQVVSSTANTRPQTDFLVIKRGRELEIVADNLKGKSFQLFDDDLLRGGQKLPPLPVASIEPTYKPAYVLPEFDSIPNPKPVVPFRLHFKSDQQDYLQEVFAEGFDNLKYHNDPHIWIVYLLNGFQGKLDEDGDSEFGLSGQADGDPGTGLNGYGAVVFQESGRETAAAYGTPGWQLPDVAPHEIGHLFGAVHEDGGLMSYDKIKTIEFEPVTLDRIRARENP